jgi:hypothetical protein
MRALAPHHPRAGVSPAPTIHGLDGPLRRIVGATLALALPLSIPPVTNLHPPSHQSVVSRTKLVLHLC